MKTILALLLVGCSSASSPPPKNTSNPSPDAWHQHASEWLAKFAAAVEASGGSCDKLADGIEPLAQGAKTVRAELDAAGKKMSDVTIDDATKAKFDKDPELLDRCENESPRVNAALDATLLTVQPL